MARNTTLITAAIDATIAERKKHLPEIAQERDCVKRQASDLRTLEGKLRALKSVSSEGETLAKVDGAMGLVSDQLKKLAAYSHRLAELEAEFKRDTLNIGVSGAARTGKSTTLQHITGLSEQQIPSGGLNPVTAVRSEIYNSDRNEADICFLTEREFIEGYVRPHVDNVNAFLPMGEKLAIASVSSLKLATLPQRLGGSVSVAATDSLKRLQEAKRSVTSYEGLLGSGEKVVSIDEVRRYVTYPSPDDERAEIAGGEPASRRYLAVKLARVYCQFPNLGSAKVGLVDLPGLGEIGNAASEIHLKGLEDKVDQIFLVMRPTAARAFTDAEVGCNLDQLRIVQPAVRQGDLVLAGINKDREAGQEAADNLRAHFQAEVNKGRADGGYEIVDYDAMESDDVARVFDVLLDRLGSLLPGMDRQKLEHCMGGAELSEGFFDMTAQLVAAMDQILRRIPSSDRVMLQRIDAISRNVMRRLDDYAEELRGAISEESGVHKSLIGDAERIHGEVSKRIADGLFRTDRAEWEDLTHGSKDYFNTYRDEAKRVRYELIDAYCGLDRFYDVHVGNFKLRALDILLDSCGMSDFFRFGPNVPADARIARVKRELGSTLRDEDLDKALDLLAKVRFDFRSNVFLQIEGCLADLANAGGPSSSERRAKSKRELLGGAGSSGEKQDLMRGFLEVDASFANDAILKALKEEKDDFNRHLAVSIDFFNNALFGKDEDNFKQIVVRGLIREYKQYVLPDADDASKSPAGEAALQIKELALALQQGKGQAVRSRNAGKPSGPSASARREFSSRPGKPKASALRKDEVLEGTVTSVRENGASVRVRNRSGFVPKGEISRKRVMDPAKFVAEGDTVRVKAIGFDRFGGNPLLSMKRCG